MLRSPDCIKPLSQILHLNGLTLVCRRIVWFLRCSDRLKPTPQILQILVRSPVKCVFMCAFRVLCRENDFEHCSQEYWHVCV